MANGRYERFAVLHCEERVIPISSQGFARRQAYPAEDLSRLLSVIKKCNDQYRQVGQSFLHMEQFLSLSKLSELSNFKRSRTMSLCLNALSIAADRGFLGFREIQCFWRKILGKVAFVVCAIKNHGTFQPRFYPWVA